MKESRADIAYNILKRDIDSGKISNGVSLVENELCMKLNMSRTPIREALNRLHAEGYLEYSPGKGFCAPYYDTVKIRHIYELIEAVEGMLAYILAQKHESLDLSKVKSAVEGMEASRDANDWDAWVTYDDAYHDAIYKLNDNEYIAHDIEILNRPAYKVRVLITKVYLDKSVSTDAHRAIYDAINNGDAELARDEAQKHYSWVKENVCKCLDNFEIL